MCGIAGFLARASAADEGTLRGMVRAIVHRGPDGTGIAQFDLPGGWRIGLGSARLAIFDPSPAGSQPMRRGDLAIVFNGSIVNHPELRADLERSGIPFRSRSDTEVLLEAWRAQGSGALPDVVGMFAFAIADLRTGDLTLGRDRFGEKPLYVAEVPGGILFGSELAAFEAHPSFRREIDVDSLRAYLALGWVPGPRTIYRGVRKLLPGTISHVGVAGAREPEPFEPFPPTSPEGRLEEPSDDALEEALSEAVRLRLRSDVPAGVFLSGGIDSSLIATLAREVGGAPLPSFTFACPGDREDESAAARRVAAHLGGEHVEVSLEPSEILAAAEAVLEEGIDEPLADYSSIPVACLARRAGRSVRVVLTGEGGDELFGGYDRYRALRWIEKIQPAPLRALAGAAVGLVGTRRSVALSRALCAREPVERALAFYGGFRAEEIEALAGPGPVPLGSFAKVHENEGDPAENARSADLRCYLVDDLLVKVDRATMRCALEARLPFLDVRVVAAALARPLRAGEPSKAPLRRLLARRFPPAWFAGPKRGFTVPLSRWLRAELRPLVERRLDPERLARFGGLAAPAVSRIVRLHLDGRVDRPSALWSLLVFEAWRERSGATFEEARSP